MLSFVIPAHNEEALIGDTIAAIRRAMTIAAPEAQACRDAAEAVPSERLPEPGSEDEAYEIVVVDDASTDRTAAIAREAGARVESVSLRKISAVRNAGARVARGDWLVFVDADTLVGAATVRGTIDALRAGAVGGGARVEMDNRTTAGGKRFAAAFMALYFRLGLAAGCYLFAHRNPFEAVGGFDERYYASEEVHLSRSLRRFGRRHGRAPFVIVKAPVETSGRKLRLYSTRELLATMLRTTFGFPWALRRSRGLEIWYEGRRE